MHTVLYLFNKHQNFAFIFFPDKISIPMDLAYSFKIASVSIQLGLDNIGNHILITLEQI